MSDIQFVRSEVERKIGRLGTYGDTMTMQELVEWLREIRDELPDEGELHGEECPGYESYCDLERERDELFTENESLKFKVGVLEEELESRPKRKARKPKDIGSADACSPVVSLRRWKEARPA